MIGNELMEDPMVHRFTAESGQALADYALILTLIFAVCVIVVGALGVAIAGSFGGILPGF